MWGKLAKLHQVIRSVDRNIHNVFTPYISSLIYGALFPENYEGEFIVKWLTIFFQECMQAYKRTVRLASKYMFHTNKYRQPASSM